MVILPRLEKDQAASFKVVVRTPNQVRLHLRIDPSTELVVEDLDPDEVAVQRHVEAFETMLAHGVPLAFDSDGLPFELSSTDSP